ncbi:DUF86 domain-containing protein [Paenibacillus thermotolerans]|uniref:DUF86 domain-containing protein n=1 Tax=Paenibacillus thermotolerans TaxID=3027807 RepID=UPI002367FC51|nr:MULTISPECIES: HepT-like ribonuclease domain-containing protein [unclassified Paenibacillus]
MYYINEDQIRLRLEFIPTITGVLRRLAEEDNRDRYDAVSGFAEERALHLAIEVVTDVGSLLIDKFILRDASSYEDIVDIIRMEGVLPDETAGRFRELIGHRRALTQQYMELDRTKLRPKEELLAVADLLDEFPKHVNAFIEKEMAGFIAPEGPKA